MPVFTLSNRAQYSLATADMPLTGTFYGQLMTSGFEFNRDTHDTMAAISSGEISIVSGYQAGGKPLVLSNSMNNTTGINTLIIEPVSWNANITGAASILLYYRPNGSSAAQQIILGCNHLGSPQSHSNGVFRIEQMKIEIGATSSSPIVIPYGTINAIVNETLNPSAGNFYAMLLGAGYTLSPTHSFRSDLTASEVTGAGYTAGGVPATLTVTRNDSNDTTIIRAEQINHPACTISPKAVAYYQRLGGAATADPVLMIAYWNVVIPSNGAVFPINPNTIEINGVYV